MPVHEPCCCGVNGKSFWTKNGLGFMQPFSGLASERRTCSTEHWRKAPSRIRERRSAEAMACIEAHGLRKQFGTTVALDGIELHVEEGRIVGLIGPNGAGKTTALNAILGLLPYQGELTVLGRNPWTQREQLMRDVSFIADVAVLPRWIKVWQVLDYVAGVHPRFDRSKAESFLAKTAIGHTRRVR